jgi:malate dehydrogenase (oxaloacetate-decarboxylating)(NADP+)
VLPAGPLADSDPDPDSEDESVGFKEEALAYHETGRPGKVKVVPSKPTVTANDLSLAYTPGVAEPCLAIAKNPDDAYRYTAKGNLVAVISNGTAVLGLGNIGALAGKPVMEGKGVLFKRFADIDVFDIEIDSTDADEIIRTCQLIAPTFGGINLEDIRAPECFEIEERLKQTLDIPVFHDDQHGTAIISAAALLNALLITDRELKDTRIVVSGAGAASIACCKLYKDLGARPENILMTDSRGVIYQGRAEGMNVHKLEFAAVTEARSLADAMVDADFFVGLSQGGVVSQEMVKSMAARPIIFAMANPDPEITPAEVRQVRDDAIIATGRSDYPNQVNNVLGFPFIFRGALDVRASAINEEMKQAAVHALAELARRGEAVPEVVRRAYPGENFDFGPNYIIPKPFDSRVLQYVSPAVAQAAMDSGVARVRIDVLAYEERLARTAIEISKL